MNIGMNRAVRIATFGAAAVLAGCTTSPSSSPGGANVSPHIASTTSASTPAGGARAEADAFFAALLAGDVKAASARVAPDFKKQLTKPVYEEELKVGYSDSDLQKLLTAWTTGHKSSSVRTEVFSPAGTSTSLRGDLTGGAETLAFALRLAKAGGGWQVTRFAVTKPVAQALPPETKNPELAWQREAAIDFLDCLLGGPDEQDLTMLAMSPEFKKRLPTPSIADPGLDYAKKDVRKWLNDLRTGFTAYAVTAQSDLKGGATFSGELRGKAAARKFTVAVVDRDGEPHVDDFIVE